MKVLMISGSARRNGNTFIALSEIAKQLEKNGIKSEIAQIGAKPIRGCIACCKCKENNVKSAATSNSDKNVNVKGANGVLSNINRCVFDDDLCNRVNEKMAESDALIVGSPVYYGQPNGSVLSLVQRMFFSAGDLYRNKPAAAVAVCRRGGATAAFQTLNMPFMMMNMPVVTSQYWNIVYGREVGQAALDTEGLQTMRTLADNMARILKNSHAEHAEPVPEREAWQPMHFIR